MPNPWSLCPSVPLSLYPSVPLSLFPLSLNLSIPLSLSPFSLCPFFPLPLYPSVPLSLYLSIPLSLCPFSLCPFFPLSLFPFLSASPSTPASLRDDIAGTASECYPGRTRRRPLPPAKCGPHPTGCGVSGFSIPSAPAAPSAGRRGSSATRGWPPACPLRTRSRCPCRVPAPYPGRTRAGCAVSIRARRILNKT
jgi:hypothetical protein